MTSFLCIRDTTIYLYSTTHSVNGPPYLYFGGNSSTRTGTESFHTEPLYILRCFPGASCDHTEPVCQSQKLGQSPAQPCAAVCTLQPSRWSQRAAGGPAALQRSAAEPAYN